MTTITREQQKQILIDTANHVISRDNTSPYSENLRELARIALASLEAEPIGAFHIADQQVGGTSDYIKDGEWPIDNGIIEVYAAPPAPVSVPDGLKQAVEFYEQVKQENIPVETGAWKDAVNWVLEEACRAAMLLANQRDLSQPVDPQVADYEKTMLQAGNSPVIPDSWALVPIVPTEDMVINGFESEPDPHFSDEKVWAEYEALSGCRRAARRAELCWAAMIKAAPKPEGNNK
ncbi:hypothetical protein J9O17_004474 [Salmonella enterica]|nr:hypothetical protein [Salmonella enterica]